MGGLGILYYISKTLTRSVGLTYGLNDKTGGWVGLLNKKGLGQVVCWCAGLWCFLWDFGLFVFLVWTWN